MRLPIAIGFGFILGSVAVAAVSDFEQAKAAAPKMTLGDYLALRVDEAKGVVSTDSGRSPGPGGSSATWKRLLKSHPMLLPPDIKANSKKCSGDSAQNYC